MALHIRRSSSSIRSSRSTQSDDADIARLNAPATIPDKCPERRPPPPVRGFHRSSNHRRSSSCGGMSADETRELWKCMLALQTRYGCYKSTRMDLAVDAGDDAVHLMPNPFIDTLNDSVIDLPEEGWEMLYRCLDDLYKVRAKGEMWE